MAGAARGVRRAGPWSAGDLRDLDYNVIGSKSIDTVPSVKVLLTTSSREQESQRVLVRYSAGDLFCSRLSKSPARERHGYRRRRGPFRPAVASEEESPCSMSC